MAGAATLCARSALRAGAGLVTAACPFAVLDTVQAQAPCATAKVVADGASAGRGRGGYARQNWPKRKAALGHWAGAWQRRKARGWRLKRWSGAISPKVIDADALFLLAKHGGGVGANTVLTPHPGEMARLCGTTVQAVLAAPVETGAAACGGSGRVRAAQGRNDGHRAGRGRGDERHGLRRHGHGRLRRCAHGRRLLRCWRRA